jgi:hypothetical protein
MLRNVLAIGPSVFLAPHVRRPFCLFYNATSYFALSLSPWILVVMALDRFVALTWPLKAANICTMRRAKATATCIITVGVFFGGLQVLRKEQLKYKSWFCPTHFDTPMDERFDTIYGVQFFYIPVILMVIFNFGIALAVNRSMTKSKYLSSTQTHSGIERTITITTMLVTSAFVLFYLPKRIHLTVWGMWRGTLTDDIITLQRFTLNLGITMENVNYSLNSYLYCMTCKRFRKELKEILSCRREKTAITAVQTLH